MHVLTPLTGDELSKVRTFISKCFSESVFNEFLERYSLLRCGWGNAVLFVDREVAEFASNLSEVRPVALGRVAGWIHGGEFVPSPWLFEELFGIAREVRCAAVVGEQGVKAFLYGNDVLVASIVRFVEPVSVGSYVAVVDGFDGRVVGVGLAVLDSERALRARREGRLLGVAIANVFDLGKLLRDERSLLLFQPAKLKPSHR